MHMCLWISTGYFLRATLYVFHRNANAKSFNTFLLGKLVKTVPIYLFTVINQMPMYHLN